MEDVVITYYNLKKIIVCNASCKWSLLVMINFVWHNSTQLSCYLFFLIRRSSYFLHPVEMRKKAQWLCEVRNLGSWESFGSFQHSSHVNNWNNLKWFWNNMIFCDCKKISYQNLKNKQRDSPELNKKFSLPKNLLFLRENP